MVQPFWRSPHRYGRLESLQCQFAVQSIADGSTDDTARKEIDDDGEIKPSCTGGNPDALDAELAAIMRFASVSCRDIDAVKNAIEFPWNNKQTEGQVTRLKMLKRAMYDRAGPGLISPRILLLNERL